MNMKIRKSTEQDLGRIMEIYESARRFMAEHGNPDQWGPTHWPPEALIRKDIADGNSYACVNDTGSVIGVFFFIYGAEIEPTYRTITEGRWLDDSPYGVVHRIASEKGSARSASTGHTTSADISGSIRTTTTSSCRTLSGNSVLSIAARSMWKRTTPRGWPMRNRERSPDERSRNQVRDQ